MTALVLGSAIEDSLYTLTCVRSSSLEFWCAAVVKIVQCGLNVTVYRYYVLYIPFIQNVGTVMLTPEIHLFSHIIGTIRVSYNYQVKHSERWMGVQFQEWDVLLSSSDAVMISVPLRLWSWLHVIFLLCYIM